MKLFISFLALSRDVSSTGDKKYYGNLLRTLTLFTERNIALFYNHPILTLLELEIIIIQRVIIIIKKN